MIYTEMMRLNKEFKTLYYRGIYKPHPKLITYCMHNHLNKTKIGITVGKKVGNAVVRNRARRIIMAAYRLIENEMDLRGYSFVFVARKEIVGTSSTELKKIMEKQIWFLQHKKCSKSITKR